MVHRYGRLLTTACLCVTGLAIVVFQPTPSYASCTAAVVDGGATPDGRPLLWKNREGMATRNELKFFAASESKEGFVGIVTSDDQEDTKIWSGVNDAGFAIINTLVSIAGIPSSNNGILMKAALETCATVDDFETFLVAWQQGALSANFGVIDAHGGAAMFEVKALANEVPTYIRSDAKDAPNGFIAVANYDSFGGEGDPGNARKERADQLLLQGRSANELTYRYMLRTVARDLGGISRDVKPDEEFSTMNFINRSFTRSASVVHGVRAGREDPRLTTFWTILGEPAFGIAVPAFSFAQSLPPQLTADTGKMAPLDEVCEAAELMAYTSNATDMTIRPYPLWYPERAVVSIQTQNGAVEDLVAVTTSLALHPWRRNPRFLQPRHLAAIENFASTIAFDLFWRPTKQ